MGLLDFLQKEDISKLGGNLLASFELEDLQNMKNDTLASAVFREIGAVPMTDLITTLTRDKAEAIARLAVVKLTKKDDGKYKTDDLLRLGSLLFVSSDVLPNTDVESVRDFVQNYTIGRFRQAACLTKAAREEWMSTLTRAFG
jgi:hypothetical protein